MSDDCIICLTQDDESMTREEAVSVALRILYHYEVNRVSFGGMVARLCKVHHKVVTNPHEGDHTAKAVPS